MKKLSLKDILETRDFQERMAAAVIVKHLNGEKISDKLLEAAKNRLRK